jgi:hypothetical protein
MFMSLNESHFSPNLFSQFSNNDSSQMQEQEILSSIQKVSRESPFCSIVFEEDISAATHPKEKLFRKSFYFSSCIFASLLLSFVIGVNHDTLSGTASLLLGVGLGLSVCAVLTCKLKEHNEKDIKKAQFTQFQTWAHSLSRKKLKGFLLYLTKNAVQKNPVLDNYRTIFKQEIEIALYIKEDEYNLGALGNAVTMLTKEGESAENINEAIAYLIEYPQITLIKYRYIQIIKNKLLSKGENSSNDVISELDAEVRRRQNLKAMGLI